MSVTPGLSTAGQGTVFSPPDDLAAPHTAGILDDLDLMAAGAQTFDELRTGASLELNLFPARPLKARGIQTFLRIHAIVDGIDQNLQMTLRLHEAAHDAKGTDRLAVFAQKAGDDGVLSLFARSQAVIGLGVEREPTAAVLQGNSGARNDNARAKALVVALDV